MSVIGTTVKITIGRSHLGKLTSKPVDCPGSKLRGDKICNRRNVYSKIVTNNSNNDNITTAATT